MRILLTTIVAALGWILVGYLLTVPLGAIFGWSGHPAIPAAPTEVYLTLYAGLLPALCLLLAWKTTRWIERPTR